MSSYVSLTLYQPLLTHVLSQLDFVHSSAYTLIVAHLPTSFLCNFFESPNFHTLHFASLDMRSFTSVALIALLATPALSAPLSLSKTGSSSSGTAGAIGGAVAGGAASAVVGNLLSKIESLFRREE